jgi:hypothetical protein
MSAAADPVGAHLGELGRALRGPAGLRRSLLREARDGLEDAAAAYRAAGHPPPRAAELAVRDFGPLAPVAAAFQDELAAGQGRRTALLLAVAFPALLVGWDLVVVDGPDGGAAMRALSAVQTAAGWLVTAAALALLGLGPHQAGTPRRIATAVAVTATAGVLVCGGTALAMNLVHGPWSGRPVGHVVTALALYPVSVLALVLVVRSTLRTVRALRAPVPC